MAEKIEATHAPMETWAGFVREGFAMGVFEVSGASAGPEKLIVGSSAVIAIRRPAQPGWLSTAFGS